MSEMKHSVEMENISLVMLTEMDSKFYYECNLLIFEMYSKIYFVYFYSSMCINHKKRIISVQSSTVSLLTVET